MKVLVTGAGGQLAWELEQTLPAGVDLISLSAAQLDITDAEKVSRVVAEVKPAVIINAAAYTAVDKAEQERELAFAVNATGAGNLARAAEKNSARMIHVSTDFVFDGTKSTPYTTEDTPNPINVYGESKLEGERLVLQECPSAVIVRTAWVYSTHGNNFVKTMLRLMSERDSLNVVSDQIGTPTYARGLAQWIWAVINKPNMSGLYNWTDEGVASWYDFAKAINEIASEMGILRKEIGIHPISTSEYPVQAARPAYSVVCKKKAKEVSGIDCSNWVSNLRTMMSKLV